MTKIWQVPFSSVPTVTSIIAPGEGRNGCQAVQPELGSVEVFWMVCSVPSLETSHTWVRPSQSCTAAPKKSLVPGKESLNSCQLVQATLGSVDVCQDELKPD